MNYSDQNELLVVVDEEDNILDYLPRFEVHKNKLLHRTITIVAFTSNRKIVLQKRSMNKDTYPGKLANAVGGHVIKGESYKDAAVNEAKEELNIQIEPELVKKIIIEDPIHRTMTSIFKITHDGPYDFNKEEIDGIEVLTLEEIKKRSDELQPSTILTLQEVELL